MSFIMEESLVPSNLRFEDILKVKRPMIVDVKIQSWSKKEEWIKESMFLLLIDSSAMPSLLNGYVFKISF